MSIIKWKDIKYPFESIISNTRGFSGYKVLSNIMVYRVKEVNGAERLMIGHV